MEGTALAERIRAQVGEDVSALGSLGLATVLVGDDEASQIYIGHKHRAAEALGIRAVDRRLPADTSEHEVLALVEELNDDDSVDGVLVQTPLPAGLDEAAITRAVRPVKDVDGLHPLNVGQLHLGRQTLVPATALGIMALLTEYRVPVAGARAVVVGRSPIVGRPVAALLLQSNATVTMCHSRTVELERHTLDADILVAAVGIPGMISPDMVQAGAAVIDVGITRTDAGLVGDVDPGVREIAGFLTPVPGGVGPMTIALLLANTVRGARYRQGLLAFPQG
jgi:methylenetetrahydrofolate dehydrogenase (NADP+) / methenyltetrahydrofolate cyclohydrolase